jgi:hypothetical protein
LIEMVHVADDLLRIIVDNDDGSEIGVDDQKQTRDSSTTESVAEWLCGKHIGTIS